MVEYRPEDQALAAEELERARREGYVMLLRIVEDAGELRARNRAMCGD